jgi:hypothetical protein
VSIHPPPGPVGSTNRRPAADIRSAEATFSSAQPATASLAFAERLRKATAEPPTGSIFFWTPEATGRKTGRRVVPAWRPIFCRVHAQLTPIELEVVEGLDGFAGFFVARKLDEGEPSRPPRFTVGADVDANNLTGGREGRAQLISCRIEAQIPNKDFS